MMKNAIEIALNEQIMKEEISSRIYLSMAIWCESNGYPGAAAFLFRQSDEERRHQLKLIHYVNDRGGKAKLFPIDSAENQFEGLKQIFEKVLDHERYITASIHEVYEAAMNEKDYSTGNFMHWYINEQIEEESTAQHILDKISLVGDAKSGMFHIDKELGEMASRK